MEKAKMQNKASVNYFINVISLLPFQLLLISGFFMLLYHTGKPYPSETIGMDGFTWMEIHKVLSIISVALILIHLIMHLNWFNKLFSKNSKLKYKSLIVILLIVFILTIGTAVTSWLFVHDIETVKGLRGIHNKLGMLLLVLFSFHLAHYMRWMVKMTKKKLFKD